eukprot:UN02207
MLPLWICSFELLVVINPRAFYIAEICIILYEATCLMKFLNLLVLYFGGSARAILILENTKPGNWPVFCAPPCCCFASCLPEQFNAKAYQYNR